MRKFFAIVVLGAVLSFASVHETKAQAFNKGTFLVEAGLGLNSFTGLYAAAEYGVTDKLGIGRIGVGASVGFPGFFSYGAYFGPEAYYHFDFAGLPKQLDLAAGLGVYFWTGYYSSLYTYVGFNAVGRWYFTDKIGVALHLGNTGGAGAAVGVVFKL
jgi:hypothetical protein